MDNWDEVRTAFQVARLGTVSGAAEVLGVHHATVIRHIDSLEGRLGVKLFQRHARGYTPTEAGLDLLQVAQATADQFEQLAGRLHGAGAAMTGELVVTSVDSFSPILLPVIAEFQDSHPELNVQYITDTRVFRLEYGEAHVAIRAGKKPEDPDNIVQPLANIEVTMGATRDYVAKYGPLNGPQDFHKHRFVGPTDENHRATFYQWMKDNLPKDRISLRLSDLRDAFQAVRAGGGIGFLPSWRFAETDELVPLWEPKPEWSVPLWLVTHVDLHRTAKVQSFTNDLKAAAKNWP
ncbi:LysR family transcriptional regulator [Actibacterium mucosum KCTC 23349]|uniref:LysR family transcriptional regulator n=1 Tax=Actibacterium mucosum KCTC 23349 TaxID=1454373 RepID=A0A037ZEY4_9RHOB|nr:LysR family transcriptional regulator [Actibacterium mucosum]KAJ54697.1 LysR family transcriptional regulator [Actibacterium mucosum KCTC 23349]